MNNLIYVVTQDMENWNRPDIRLYSSFYSLRKSRVFTQDEINKIVKLGINCGVKINDNTWIYLYEAK